MCKEVEFEICRTSLNWEEKPCKSAYPKQVIRTFRSGRSDWYNREVTRWFIEVSTIEELIELQREAVHSIILNEQTIEIYDDYRE